MNIVYIYDGGWPRGATRVRKQTAALADAGHGVLLLARNEERAPRLDREAWMEVRRLPTVPGSMTNRLFNFPFFLNPVWIAHILRHSRDWQAEALVVEDLPLAPTALWIGRAMGVPVFYDMGEVYPEFLRGLWEKGNPSLLDRIVRNPAAAGALERYVLDRADHTFVVSEESRTRALERGADADRISIVGNTPEFPRTLISPRPRPLEIADLEGRPTVLFTGILIFDRGIGDAVRALDEVRKRIRDVAFVIVGAGPAVPAIEEEVTRRGLEEHVRMVGWQDHGNLPGFYQAASVGLLPFANSGQIRYTLANKLFDYMGAGLPVIASDVPPMRRIVTETGCGRLVAPESPTALAEGIVEVLRLPEPERRAMGRRGREAIESRYNWAADSKRFVAAFTQVQ